MLDALRIKDYALIDELEVTFQPGLSALTGETGAGKSIIIEALHLALGARASSDAVREGRPRAHIEAVFRLAALPPRLQALFDAHGLEPENGEVVIARSVSSDGRSRAYVCGVMVPASVLAEVGDELVDMHGQHEHQSLLKLDRQLELLDTYGETTATAQQVARLSQDIRRLAREIADLESSDRDRERRLDFLRFEVKEIDDAGLESGEEEEVRSRRNLITNSEHIVELARQAYAALYEAEGSAIDQLAATGRALRDLAAIDATFQELPVQLDSAREILEDVAAQTRDASEGVEYDAVELERLNQRMVAIADLKRKYGDSITAILAYRDQAAEEIARYEGKDERVAMLQRERDALRVEAELIATILSSRRGEAASRLDMSVTKALQKLGMKGGRFVTSIEPRELCADGVDRVEFLLAANAGEKAKPLRQVASGGEMSRIMLALKSTLAAADRIPTLIFDEVDAGIGGAVANQVAGTLRELAASHQVLCITHLPQIAAAATDHFTVAKSQANDRTITTLARVEGYARIAEIARLLDGSGSEVSLKHAKALLGGK